jgi:hypothetical protein
MEAIMKKKLLMALAIVMGAGSMLPLVASVETMYQDIMGSIVNNSLVQNDEQRLDQLTRSLDQVYSQKRNAEELLIWTHGTMYIGDKMSGAVMAGLSLLSLALGYASPVATVAEVAFLSGTCGVLSIGLFMQKNIERYFDKKKLVEFNVVIAKLEAAKAELEQKVKTTQLA